VLSSSSFFDVTDFVSMNRYGYGFLC